MSIIGHSNFDKTVSIISERNSIVKKINHMAAVIKDNIIDFNVGDVI